MTEKPARTPVGGSEGAAGRLPHLQSLDEARGWVGAKLDELGGETAGRVEGVLVDSKSGEPAWLVFRVGRRGYRSAIPFVTAAGGVGHVWVPYPRDAIRRAPEVDPEAGLELRREIELCDHFGLPTDAGRRIEIEGREDESFTSVPA